MIRILCALALLSLPLGFSGCASIDAQAISCWGDDAPGIRYYMPEPYFLVTKNPGLEPVFRLFKEPQKFKIATPSPIRLGEWTDAKAGRASIAKLQPSLPAIKLPSDPVPSRDGGSTIIDIQVDKAEAAKGAISLTAEEPNGASWKVTLPFHLSKISEDTVEIAFQEKGAEIPTEIVRAVKVEILYLPNPDRIVAIEQDGGIGGTSELDIEIENGWRLKSLGGKTDSKTPETIGAIATLIEKAGGVAGSLIPLLQSGSESEKAVATPQQPEAILYALSYDGNGRIEGLQPITFAPPSPSMAK